ncbi:MAG: 4-hydroxythreonine-4-phosphate dehydrogenase PdxA [Verrucomicrobia bacterium]|nr:4-hydroxythreonine-4-phosphate dehydrogenase PdxA [Verrucomicrobiota bacterium]
MRVLGVTLGDGRGIGPEVAFKAVARTGIVKRGAVLLIAEHQKIKENAGRQGWTTAIPEWPGRSQEAPGLWWTPPENNPEFQGEADPDGQAARAAIQSLTTGSRLALSGQIDALVTGPVNKASIIRAGVPFMGQTEWLTQLAGNPSTGMLLLGKDSRQRWLRVLLATTHVPLAAVPGLITQEGLLASMELAVRACRDLGLRMARIAVCGLNPHAGEEGKMGQEEQTILSPAIERAREEGLKVTGPWPGDTIFRDAIEGRHEVVLAMYHDQGLAPLKLVAFETGVNWTVGLPYPRTSPDHGTAFDIAGKDVADPTSMAEAIELAWKLVEGRKDPDRNHGVNPVTEISPEEPG